MMATSMSAVAPVPEEHGRFGLALVAILLAIIATAGAGASDWARLIGVVFMGAALLLILRTSEARPRVRLTAVAVVAAAVLATGVAAAVGDDDLSGWAIPTVGAFLALVAPVAIVRALALHRSVTYQTIFGALCLYLLVGMFFAFLYSVVDVFTDGPLFVGPGAGKATDDVYFSFVTITTTGFGDVTVGTNLGRMLAITEGLIGQLYLVSVVAVLVANLGQPRARPLAHRASRGDQGGPGQAPRHGDDSPARG
jgi:Ion channel